MEKISLPDGGWAQLRDAEQVRERHRRPLMKAFAGTSMFKNASDGSTAEPTADEVAAVASTVTPDDLAELDTINDLLIVAFVESWSLDMEVTTDSVVDLPVPVFAALAGACMERFPRLMVNFEPTPDQSSPS